MAKRKHDEAADPGPVKGSSKKIKPTVGAPQSIASKFRSGLFEEEHELQLLKESYARSVPYKHGVLYDLIDDKLLTGVLEEIQTQISFTEKETDIYRIYQSGDLANLDGLDSASLKKLPSLLKLRNALYSEPFRTYLSSITGAGPLSGKKTDMAINIYRPGCYLLCHDDVIGSRRVSYILYLTKEWNQQWGGALRLYPTSVEKNPRGAKVHVPSPDFTVSIPPRWNQMSFFAVQPGESYHDVEEVYPKGFRPEDDVANDDQRIRIAISGWFHIPQPGEDGYKKGKEETEAKKSSLMQLKSQDTHFDYPENYPIPYPCYNFSVPQFMRPGSQQYEAMKTAGWQLGPPTGLIAPQRPDDSWDGLSEADCNFLLSFINPHLLVPSRVRAINRAFTEEQSIVIEDFLHPKFAQVLKDAIRQEPDRVNDLAMKEVENTIWSVAQPPHKRRYLYIPPTECDPNHQNLLSVKPKQSSPIKQLLSEFLPSMQFRKWLGFATGLIAKSHDLRARRFRRGLDYELATSYDKEQPRLELTLGLSPDGKWEAEMPEVDDESDIKPEDLPEPVRNGGEECYMAPLESREPASRATAAPTIASTAPAAPTVANELSSESESESSSSSSDSEEEQYPGRRKRKHKPSKTKPRKMAKTGAADVSFDSSATAVTSSFSSLESSQPKVEQEDDPAVYQAGEGDEDDVLFHMAAGWNRLSLVTRDTGTLKYVRFVNSAAGADRWDISGDYEVDWDKTDELDLEADESEGEADDDDEEAETEVEGEIEGKGKTKELKA